MPLFLTQDKDFFPAALTEKFCFVRRLGFDGLEIDGRLLLEQFDAVEEAMKRTGLPVPTACGGYRGWIGDFDEGKRQQAIEDISLILHRLSLLGGKGIVVPAAWGMFSLRLPPMIPPRTAEEDRRVLLDSLSLLDAVAGEHGVQVFLEPLNRYEDHMINTLSDARALIDEGSFAHVSIIADFYHMNIEEAQIAESLLEQEHCIGHVHLADSHRFQPGSGHTDFTAGFRALRQWGYAGAFSFECRVRGSDVVNAYQRSLDHIRAIYEQSATS